MARLPTKRFQNIVYRHYEKQGRDLPWRRTSDPYKILVSEIMLQQTQVRRVIEKYPGFLRQFPSLKSLAQAPLDMVMRSWQGLGYNRRALSLKRLASMVITRYGGKIPRQRELLKTLPGVGDATSGAMCAFAFNEPVAFIETNIRSVFIHHFFPRHRRVSDEQIMHFIAMTVDRDNPRKWYYALMDYGVYLKSVYPNPGRKSRHYTKQSAFEGSDRQLRGMILKKLLEQGSMDSSECNTLDRAGKSRGARIIACLLNDGLIEKKGKRIMIKNH